MYLTIKHLFKEDYRSIKELCHVVKNFTNQAIYNIRQLIDRRQQHVNATIELMTI